MSDSEEELLLFLHQQNSLAALIIRSRLGVEYKKRETESSLKNKRRCWLNDRICKGNLQYGIYGLVKELSSNEDKIVQNLNISPVDFYELLDLIKNDIHKSTTRLRDPIPAESRLSITLRYLNCGINNAELGRCLFIGKYTAQKIALETCNAIYRRLQPIVMPQLSLEKLCEVAAKMKEVTQFPNCVGILDGKCIFARKYYQPNRTKGLQQKSGAVLFGLVDPTCCFLAVNLVPHIESDVQDFLSSLLDSMIAEEKMPPPNLLPDTGVFLPHVVLGSEYLPLTKYLMTPYTLDELLQDPGKGIYNKMHCQALELAGRTFGLMVHRFKVFQNQNVSNYETKDIIIKACCCLHNFLRLKDLSRNNDQVDEISIKQALENAKFDALKPYAGTKTAIGREVRENFLAYFSKQSNISIKKERTD